MCSRNKLLAMDKIFCPGQNVFCVGQYFLSGTKLILPGTKDILSMQMAWAYVEEMNFLSMDKIFCLRQKNFVPDKFEFV